MRSAILSSAGMISRVVAISLAIFAGLAIFGTPAASHVFRNYANNSFEILTSLTVVVGVFLFMTNLSVVESTQIALQEGYKLNTAIGFGTLFAALCVFMAAKTTPMVVTILLAVNLPTILARLWNAIYFIKVNTFLRYGFRRPNRAIASSLLKDGALFSFSGSVNNFLSHFFPIIVIGKICEPDYSASYSALIAALIIFSSFFSITAVPLLGALPEARIRNDFRWIRKVYIGVLRSNITFSIVVAAGLWLFGSELFAVWYQGKVNPSGAILKYSGLYFVLLSLEVTNFSFLSSLGHIRISSIFLAIKAILFVGLFLFLSNPVMMQLPFVLLILTNFLFSAIPLTVISWRSMRA